VWTDEFDGFPVAADKLLQNSEQAVPLVSAIIAKEPVGPTPNEIRTAQRRQFLLHGPESECRSAREFPNILLARPLGEEMQKNLGAHVGKQGVQNRFHGISESTDMNLTA
jgi:hypothetical protein